MDATLVVDDDDIVLTVLSKVIDRAGIRYFATTDPTEALRLLSEGKFNLLVTDLVMDEVDGIELFCRAREQQPLLRGICTSAFMDQDKLTRVVGAGFDDCLIKPIRSDRLIQGTSLNSGRARRRRFLVLPRRWG